MSDPLRLPFDQYQRYRIGADLLAELRAPGERLDVLDVGGRTGLLRGFLAGDRVRLVDLEPCAGTADLVLGSGAALPFADDSVDAVCAFDTLEHVPPAERDAFVDECARVARRWVLLVGPWNDPGVADAERLLDRFASEKLGIEHRYLREHVEHGLPDRDAAGRRLAERGARVASVGHGRLDRWMLLMCLELYLEEDPALRGIAGEVYAHYNARLHDSDRGPEVYRRALVAAFEGAALPSEREEAPEPAPAPLAPWTRLALELAAFDRERDAWRAERATLRACVDELERDLAGHREVLADRERLLEEHRAALAEWRARAENLARDLQELRWMLPGL